jgi:hypothetical protein
MNKSIQETQSADAGKDGEIQNRAILLKAIRDQHRYYYFRLQVYPFF